MTTQKSGETFMEYQTIDLSIIPSETTQLHSHIDERFSSFSKNEEWNGEMVLFGENADFITSLRVFVILRRRCTEIVYKTKEESSGTIIFSLHERGQVLRPGREKEILWLSPEEEKRLKHTKDDFVQKESLVDIEALWKKVSDTYSEDKRGAALVFLIEPSKGDSLELKGWIPLLDAFIVLSYLLATKKTITWNDVKLK